MFECLPELSIRELSANIIKLFDEYNLQDSYMYMFTNTGLYIQRINRTSSSSRTSVNLSINLVNNTIKLHKFNMTTRSRHAYPTILRLKRLNILEKKFEHLIKTVL